MRFSMLGVLALTLSCLFGTDAQAFGRRKAKHDCCPTPVVVSPCCGGGYGSSGGYHWGYGYAGHGYGSSGFAVASPMGVDPQSMPMTVTNSSSATSSTAANNPTPTTGTVTSAAGTTANMTGGIVQTSGTSTVPTTGIPMQTVPYQGVAMTTYAGMYASDSSCTPDNSGTSRRRGLFRR